MALRLAKVLANINLRQTVKVFVPKLQFDDFLKMHFRENDELYVHDPQEQCRPGDWILVRKLDQPMSLKVQHQLVRVVYENGNKICPITGKKAVGYKFEDEISKDAELFGMKKFAERAQDIDFVPKPRDT